MDARLRWQMSEGYQLSGVTWTSADGGLLLATGQRTVAGRTESAIFAVDGSGCVVQRVELTHPRDDRHVCVFPNVIDVPDRGPCLFYSSGASDNDRPEPGRAVLVDLADWSEVWRVPTRSQHAGNGSCLVADVDGDGEAEIIWWDSATVFCNRLSDGVEKWRHTDRVQICHGRPTLSDVNGDGIPEIVLGTEYSDGDGNSSILALDGRGDAVWRHDGFPDDLGSTPVIRADVISDGVEEFTIVGLDLEHKRSEGWSSLWCFSADGELIYRAPCGCGGIAVGPIADDGWLSGIGLTNSRDGGTHGRAEVRCFDLATGALAWATPIPRVHLDAQNPVMCELAPGEFGAIVATGNPSGYGRRDDMPPFGDVYLVDSVGEISWSTTLDYWVHQPIVGDIDGDGRSELLLPCGDGSLTCYALPFPGSTPWSTTGGGYERWYLAAADPARSLPAGR